MIEKMKPVAVSFLLAAIPAGASVLAAEPDDCSCLGKGGQTYSLGQVTCLQVDNHDFLARCEMNLNVTSWRKLNNGCAATVPLSEDATPVDTSCTPWHVKVSLR